MEIDPKQLLIKLVESKLLTQESATQLEQESIQKKIPLEQYLETSGAVTGEDIVKIKGSLLNLQAVNIAATPIDPQALNFIPKLVAQEHQLIPYQFDPTSRKLYVATANPTNLTAIDYLTKKKDIILVPVLATQTSIQKALNIAYSLNLSPMVKEAVADISEAVEAPVESLSTSNEFNSAPIAKIVNTVVEFGIKNRASDIHIEPQELRTRVRYRIDGILMEKLSLPRSIHESLISRIKILGGMKIDEKRIPQDGRFHYKLNNEEVDLRVSSLPTVYGEKIVSRLLRKSGGLPPLNELGLDGVQLKRFEEGISRSYGIVLVTGPTGSGKTTTLYSVLSKLNTKSVNIVTLEDPVEYQIEGINQVQINAQAGLTFATGLKSFLRQDPNIMLVGEIRDKETTQLAVQAALTGHLVFSTLHTNDAATAVPRLIDLGGEPFLIASVLSIIMAQRIVRKVCPTCKELYEPTEEVKTSIKTFLGAVLPKQYQTGEPIHLARGKGCEECNHSGYLGRLGIFEILKTSPQINALVLNEASSHDIEAQAMKEGMVLMKQDGYLKALAGLTTIEEIMRVTES